MSCARSHTKRAADTRSSLRMVETAGCWHLARLVGLWLSVRAVANRAVGARVFIVFDRFRRTFLVADILCSACVFLITCGESIHWSLIEEMGP